MKKQFINKPLFKLERKANLLPLIIFIVAISITMIITAGIYPYIQEAFKMLPEELQGMVSFDSAKEYFSAEAIEVWVVLGAMYTAWLALRLTTGDFKNGNAEMLYSLNISRGEILRTKFLRLVLNTTIYNLALAIVCFVSLWVFCGEMVIGEMLVFALFALLSNLIVGMLMFGLGTIVGRRFSPMAGVVIVVLFYLISSISMATSQVEWLGFFSPFTSLFGDVISNGFAGLKNYGASLIIWGGVSIFTFIFGLINFKNVDLD